MSRELAEDIIGLVLVALLFILPILVYRHTIRLARRAGHRPAAVYLGAASMALITVAIVLPVLAVYIVVSLESRPGPVDAPRRVKRETAPIVAALGRYRDARGAYPSSLHLMIPEFLAEGVLPLRPNGGDHLLRYFADSAGSTYELWFARSGKSDCRFTPATQWECVGRN
jgi:hypothetical protein